MCRNPLVSQVRALFASLAISFSVVSTLVLPLPAECQASAAEQRQKAVGSLRPVLREILVAAAAATNDPETVLVLDPLADLQAFTRDPAGVAETLTLGQALVKRTSKGGKAPMKDLLPMISARLAAAHARANDFAAAEKVASGIRDEEAATTAWGEIAMAKAAAGDAAGALSVADRVKKNDDRLGIAVAIGVERIRAGDEKGGLALVENSPFLKQKVKEWTAKSELPMLDFRVLAYFIRRVAALGPCPDNFQFARGATIELMDNFHEPFHMGLVAAAKSFAGDHSLVDRFLAWQSDKEYANLAGAVIPGLIMADDLDDALKLAEATKQRDARSEAFSLVALARAHKADFGGSLNAVGSIENRPIRAVTLAAITDLQAGVDPAGANQTLAIALEALNATRTEFFVLFSRLRLAMAQSALGDAAAAKASFDVARQIAAKGVAGYGFDYFDSAVIRVRAATGDMRGALASLMPANLDKTPMNWEFDLSSIARRQAVLGDREGAFRTLAAGISHGCKFEKTADYKAMSAVSRFSEQMAAIDPARAIGAARELQTPAHRALALLRVAQAMVNPKVSQSDPDPIFAAASWVLRPYEM